MLLKNCGVFHAAAGFGKNRRRYENAGDGATVYSANPRQCGRRRRPQSSEGNCRQAEKADSQADPKTTEMEAEAGEVVDCGNTGALGVCGICCDVAHAIYCRSQWSNHSTLRSGCL